MRNRAKPFPVYAIQVTKLGKAKARHCDPAYPAIAPPTAPAMHADSIALGFFMVTPNNAGSVTPRADEKAA